MAQGLFTLRQQVQGIVQKAWNTPVGTYAGSFNGSSQRLTLPALTSLTGNFTVEFYCNSTGFGTGDATVFSNYSATSTASEVLIIQRQTSGQWGVYCGSLSGAGNLTWTPTASSSNVWVHVALVRSGSTVTAYYNGVSVATATVSSTITLPSGTSIGAYTTGANFFLGYISNLRITNTVVYASNFSPPAVPLAAITGTQLLTLQNATIVDNSTNAYTITNVGSITTLAVMPFTQLSTPAVDYLVVAGGGGGSYLGGGGGAGGLLQGSVPVASGSAITVTVGSGGAGGTGGSGGASGTNSVFGAISATGGGAGGSYPSTAGASGGSGGGGQATEPAGTNDRKFGQGILGQGNAGGQSAPGGNYIGGGGGGAGTTSSSATSSSAGNGGAGIASAINGTVTTYAGGGGGAADSGGTGGSGGVGGGGAGGVSRGATGGSGTVNGVTGSTNTGGGGGAFGVGGAGGAGGSGIVIVSYPDVYAAAASTTGSPTVSTTGSGSLYFNNPSGVSNQAITYTTTSAQSLGSGDFCIEAFVWWSSSSGAAPYIATNFVGSTNYYWGLYQQGTIGFYVYGGVYLNAGTFTNNAWNHIVVCRTSGTTSMFLNGTRTATASDSVTYATGATSLYVGQNNLGTNFLNGYLSNFRIVVGNSIYSASATTITVPTAPFAATSQTKILLSTVSPNGYLDSSSSNLTPTLASNSGSVSWNQLSPFATGLGYKNRVYTFTSSGTVTLTF